MKIPKATLDNNNTRHGNSRLGWCNCVEHRRWGVGVAVRSYGITTYSIKLRRHITATNGNEMKAFVGTTVTNTGKNHMYMWFNVQFRPLTTQ